MRNSDLQVDIISDALANWALDVVVSGSIGAVESVRFIRALRRLGAKVTPWLTEGGAQFITETALAWAADSEVRTTFSGNATHIATSDAVLIIPASASMIGRIANGMTDTPASALVASHMGSKNPVLFLPNMHLSLSESPAVDANIKKIESFGAIRLQSRNEEGKNKFLDPKILADLVGNELNRSKTEDHPVLITMGSTRGYIDDVRYVSNYSSGKLGSLVSEELFRLGYATHVVSGPCPNKPHIYKKLQNTLTNDEMEKEALAAIRQGAKAAVMAASVLDFTPIEKKSGKIKSSASKMTVDFDHTSKIISQINPDSGIKVGFKLETDLTVVQAQKIAEEYMPKYGLSLFVLNDLADVSATEHKATIYEKGTQAPIQISGKAKLANYIAAHISTNLQVQ
jgi:phosphopantothenoylcysteine decarboxylase / phosphopantothenate---cysteine ligase